MAPQAIITAAVQIPRDKCVSKIAPPLGGPGERPIYAGRFDMETRKALAEERRAVVGSSRPFAHSGKSAVHKRPSLNDRQLIVERRSLRAARSLPRAKSRGALVETTEIITCDSPTPLSPPPNVGYTPRTKRR